MDSHTGAGRVVALYTAGYAHHSRESFLELVRRYGIDVVADVRSAPYSAYKPEFNREFLAAFLKLHGIGYVYLGGSLGARFDDPAVYVGGVADFERIAKHEVFLEGLDRIRKGLQHYTPVLMCAEKDPIACHRAILISRQLRNAVNVQHILGDGELESHGQLEQRLLQLHKLGLVTMPGVTFNGRTPLEQAYLLQAAKIAYRAGGTGAQEEGGEEAGGHD